MKTTGPGTSRTQYTLAAGALVVCIAPLVLQWLGVDFASGHAALDAAAAPTMKAPQLADQMHHALSGSFTHTMLELAASLAAVFTVVFAFAHYSIKRDMTTLLICIALFFAACMDGFHTVAADRLISSSASPATLVPFTWAMCRFFNAVILLGGAAVFAFRSSTLRPRPAMLAGVGVGLAVIAYVLIHLCAVSPNLPVTMFPKAAIKRPYDVAALVLFVIAGVFVLPRYVRKHPSPFSYALWISAIPQVATQLYMSFGSTALFDAAFNIAHFLKIIAYTMPFLGLLLDYIATHKAEQRALADLKRHQLELEDTVALRTAELRQSNDSVKLILDNAHDGMFTVDLTGAMSSEHSAVLDSWFGPVAPGATFRSYIGASAPELADMFQLGLDEIAADIMPLEVTLDQMPKTAVIRDRHYTLTYQPIRDAGQLTRLLVVVTDITAEIEHQRETRRQEEVLRIFRACQHDKSGFQSFFSEAGELVAAIAAARQPAALGKAKRLLHTLKGNTALFGITSVSELCHDIESNIAAGGALVEDDIARLTSMWAAVSVVIAQIVEADGRHQALEVSDAELAAMLDAIAQGMPRDEIVSTLSRWQFEPTERLLGRLADQSTAIARRLGKTIEPVVESNGLRLCKQLWSSVWSTLPHAVRNAVDHGVEPGAERAAQGKAEAGKLVFRTRLAEGRLLIEIEDDGRGVAWDAVADKARAMQLPHATQAELVEALFAEGVSTKAEVSDLSGRGVGMAAVREACRALGGDVEIVSTPTRGTLVRCSFSAATALVSSNPKLQNRLGVRRDRPTSLSGHLPT